MIKITVDSAYRHITSSERITLSPGETRSIKLHKNEFDDRYEIRYITTAPIQFAKIKQKDIEKNNPTPDLFIKKILTGRGIDFIKIPPTDQYIILGLRNYNNYGVDSHIQIDRVGTRPKSVRKNLERVINITIDALSKTYDLPDIQITVKPCGQINAFSTPNIIICTELVGDLAEKDTIGAIHSIILHELAHSLMYIWKIGDYEDEDLADEFAMVLMSISAPEALNDLIRWFEIQDSRSEIIMKNINKGTHSLSIQRAEAARNVLLDPTELLEKWGRLLHPYAK